MNKLFFTLLLLLSLHTFGQKNISFPVAKFHTGDDAAWKDANFDDTQWPSIKTNEDWELQGYDKYDGYAWYRIKFMLPSSLKKNAYWKDTLSFHLGKIDDVDETFFNGEKIGQTGALPTDNGGYSGMWDAYRIYNLPATSNLIQWDKENIIAIKVYDHGGNGGMFGGVPFIKLLEPIDVVDVGLDEDAAISSKYICSAENSSGKAIEGSLIISVRDGAANKIIKSIIKPVTIPAGKAITENITTAINKRYEITGSFKEKHTGEIKSKLKVTPYILTPPVSDKPRINSAKVFGVRPNSPIIFKVAATGKKPLRYTASNLPNGLTIDETDGIITGKEQTKGN
jgi:alpha-galactosidase